MADPSPQYAPKLTGEQIRILFSITGPRASDPAAIELGDWSVDLDRRMRAALEAEEQLAKLDAAERAFIEELEQQLDAYRTGTAGTRHPVAAWFRALADKLDPDCVDDRFVQELE